MVFGLRLATAVPIFIRWLGTPIQIYVKRRAESNPAFRAWIVKNTRWYNTKSVEWRLKRNNLERTPEQIQKISKMEEDKAIIAGAELLSSTIGTGITIFVMGISIWFFHDDSEKIEQQKYKEKVDSLATAVQDLRTDVRRLETGLKNVKKISEEETRRLKEVSREVERLDGLMKEQASRGRGP